MSTMAGSIIKSDTVFAWIAAATFLILLIPLVAMQFTAEVTWDFLDFIVMGALLFGAGSVFVVAARRAPQKHWAAIGFVVAVVLFCTWAELAVGIFTNVGR